MNEVSKEYEALEKYSPDWIGEFTKDRGRGWSLLTVHPSVREEKNRIVVEEWRKGMKVLAAYHPAYKLYYDKSRIGSPGYYDIWVKSAAGTITFTRLTDKNSLRQRKGG